MTTILPNTTVWVSKTYKQCLGKAWDGRGQCSSCGADVGTGGTCMAMVEIVPEVEPCEQK